MAKLVPRTFTKKVPKTGRYPQREDAVPFKAELPFVLKHAVSTEGRKETELPCIKETLAFITCLKDNNNSHELCRAQGEAVTACYSTYTAQRNEIRKKPKKNTDFAPDKSLREMDSIQLNRFLSHFKHKIKKNK